MSKTTELVQDRPGEATPTSENAPKSVAEAPETDENAAVDESPTEPENGNKEAAGYRRKLRDAEAERDTMATQLAASRDALIDRLAEDNRVTPAALRTQVSNISDVLDDDGHVDVEKVAAAAEAAAEALHLVRRPKPDMGQGRGSGDLTMPPSFENAFAPKR